MLSLCSIMSMKPAAMQRIRNEYISDPEFSPEKVAVKAKAAASLCNWVLALEQYDRIKKVEHSPPLAQKKENILRIL